MLKYAFAIAAMAAALAAPARADLSVFACEPEWGALAKEIGGDKVSIYTATTGAQDPHQIQARPSLIAKARSADIAVCTGGELEIAWMPMVAQQAANPKLQSGADGMFEAASFVRLAEVPVKFDRAQGDIHAQGNPHIQTDPRNILAVAKPLADRFAKLDPANAAAYQANHADFAKRWNAALARWNTEAAPLRGTPIVVSHTSWIYLEQWLGLKRVVALEPKPGVPPSSGYLAEVLAKLQATPAKVVIRAAYEDDRPAEFVNERANIPIAVLPFTIGGTPEAKDLFSLYDETIKRLKDAVAK
jgi:zinc/manganese transport system substrate-binding protein